MLFHEKVNRKTSSTPNGFSCNVHKCVVISSVTAVYGEGVIAFCIFFSLADSNIAYNSN